MPRKKRHILRDFTINEICLVGDFGRVVLMKRAEPWDESERRRRFQLALEELGRQLLDNSQALAEHWHPLSNLLRLAADLGKQSRDLQSQSGLFSHSPDYRSVTLRGRPYFLTPLQAQVVQILHENFLNGTPDIGQHALLEMIESKQKRLRDVFETSDAWGELVVPGKTKGTSRINVQFPHNPPPTPPLAPPHHMRSLNRANRRTSG